MAAVDPSKSLNREKTPTVEVGTSGEKGEAAESRCSVGREVDGTAGSPDGERRAEAAAARGADKTTCASPEDPTAAEKMAEAPGIRQRAYDWSGTEEDDDERAKTEENKRDFSKAAKTAEEVTQDKHVVGDAEKTAAAEEGSPDKENRGEKSPVKGQGGEVDLAEETGEDNEEADSTAKEKNFCLVCKDCGMRFKRREMFNLHRHFHAHEDEFSPLICKECGLTFQHRNSLIKHRNEHKEKEEALVTPKMEVQTMEDVSRYQCAECQMIFTTVKKLRNHSCVNAEERPYHCPLCRQDFQFKVSVTRHMMTHSQECLFKCQECSQTFPNVTTLRFHLKSHSALKPYECPECGMAFKHYSVMEDHRRKHIDTSRCHRCNICGKSFKYSSLLHQHQYLHTGQKPFRCPECGKKFAFAQNMKAHCRQHRLREINSFSKPSNKQDSVSIQETLKEPRNENSHKIEEPKRTFNCPLCPQTFCLAANLRAHMLIHEAEYDKLERTAQSPKETSKHWEKGYTCPNCPSVFRNETSFNMHLLNAHNSPRQYLERMTAQPKQQFTPSSDNVQETWKSETGKLHKCSECDKAFRHRSVLELHMRIHSKDKPYVCRVCGKGFRFGSYLQQHLVIHTGTKPYKCPDCGKDFAFLQNMRTHQKLHQEKPFRCTSCRKGYSDEVQLQQHMLSHNGDKPHKCDQCDKSFGLAYLLRDHMNTHTGERPHRCNECNKTFSWFSSLLVHQKIHTRKKQTYSQCTSFPASARMRGRGRRGGRFLWSWSKPLEGSPLGTQQPLYPHSPVRDAELHGKAPQSSMLQSHMDLQNRQSEPWPSEPHAQPEQWKVDGGEVMPVPSTQQQHGAPQPPHTQFNSSMQLQQNHQRSSGWPDIPMLHQPGPVTAHSSDAHIKESISSVVNCHMPKQLPVSQSAGNEMVQPRLQNPLTWSSTPTSPALASTSSVQHNFTVPASYMDGAALWSIRPAPLTQSSPNKLVQELQLPRWQTAPASSQMELSAPPKKEERMWDLSSSQGISSTVTQPEKPWNGCELQKPWASGLASTSAQIDQSSAVQISTPVSHGITNTLWDIQTSPGIPKTVNSTEKLVNNQDFQLQQKQVSPGWANMQPATQKGPISIQYEPHRFGQGMGSPVWGFQNNPVNPQTLLSAQLKAGGGQELQQQPMVTGTQIIINQPSPFFSPPLAPLPPPLALSNPHPLHSVAISGLPRHPHPNMFFTPQTVMSERPHLPQTLTLPQLAPHTESHKLGPRLSFTPERILQCMICGCSFPRELDLRMHYLQHTQGDM